MGISYKKAGKAVMSSGKENIGILVVLYNKPAEESETLRTLKETDGCTVLVLDNSTQLYSSEEYCKKRGFFYHRFGENKGLSKAYNYGALRLKDSCAAICIFDDDTSVAPEYLQAVREALKGCSQNHIFLPLIYDQEGLLSPSRFQGNESLRASDPEQISREEITGINTGCCITSDVFEKVSYDEKLFLDFVDHRFIAQAKKRDVRISLLPIRLKQDFSDQSRQPLKSAVSRFSVYSRDCLRFYQADKGYALKRIFLRCIKLTVKYHSFRFLPAAFKSIAG